MRPDFSISARGGARATVTRALPALGLGLLLAACCDGTTDPDRLAGGIEEQEDPWRCG